MRRKGSRTPLRVPTTSERLAFFFQAEDGIRDLTVTGVQTCALPISLEQRAHRAPVQRAIALCARRPHRWSLGAVEHAELNRRAIGSAAHDAAERVDLDRKSVV